MLKLLKFSSVNALQPWNIRDISITLDVLKLLTSSVVNSRQDMNIFDISVTFDVSKMLLNVIDVKLVNLLEELELLNK